MAGMSDRTRRGPRPVTSPPVELTPVTAGGRPTSLPEELTPWHRGGDGTPLVLLHGFTMSWRAWLPVLPYLSAHHTVLAMTMAGHRGGPALLPDGRPGAAALADTICRQLDELGLDTVHAAGNSLGGWTALELARRGRARSVVGISPGGSWRKPGDMQALLRKFRVSLALLANDRMRPLVLSGPARRAWLRQMARHPERIPREHVQDYLEDIAGCDLITLLLQAGHELQPLAPLDIAHCPVRIAWAEYDRVIPYRRFGHPMRAVIPGAEFITLPKVGHVPMYDDPRLVARTILEVTREVDLAAGGRGARRADRSA